MTNKKIKLLAMDVDGTLTDGHIYTSSDGEIMKAFNVKDGLGIGLLHKAGIITAVITGRQSDIVINRGNELGIKEIIQRISKKDEAIFELMSKYNVSLDEIAYIGDDLNDLSAINIVGLSACPSDAVTEVKNRCDVVMDYCGGQGAVRQFSEYILKGQNIYDTICSQIYDINVQ